MEIIMRSPQTLEFKMRFDPSTGNFQLEVQKGLWSGSLLMTDIEKIIHQEVNRRCNEPSDDRGLLPTDFILIHKLLQTTQNIRRYPATAKEIKPSTDQVADELLELLGLSK